ncbi:MAG: 6-bladed beta-propeller [Bacteroidetes bacterium]|nr:MAG: 6-bladed beta-propeller [Bacteroidota bacterium]
MKLIKIILLYILFLIITFTFVISRNTILINETKSDETDSVSESFDIKWIEKISTDKDLNYKKGFLKKVVEFVAGEEFKGLVKPVNVIAIDTATFIVADQGIQNPLLIEKNTGKFNKVGSNENSYPSLVGICFANSGKIFFTDSKNDKIYVMNNKDDTPRILNDTLILNQPTGIAYSNSKDEIWISETANHRIMILDGNGNLKRTIGKRGTSSGEFNFPTYIWIDSEENVYIVDAMNFRIQILSNQGEVLSVFGEAGNSTGYIASPKGIATDSYGHIFLVDALFNSVQVFDRKGNFLYYFGTQGKADGEFWLPSGIFIDKNDRIYIADSYNSRIQIFQLIKGVQNEK